MVDYENELNPEQYEAATAIHGPLRILAGAGSGKTRTLTYRTMYMIENGILPENILLLTFTNKAADEMKERICKLVPEGNRVTACTFHSFCVEILRRYGALLGIKNFTILAPGDDAEIVKMIRSADKNYKYPKGFPKSSTIASVLSASINTQRSISRIINEDYPKYREFSYKIMSLIDSFNAYRKENNTLNYDDLLVETLRLFNEYPNVVQKLADQYHYIMVDEYQDSNALQEKLLFSFQKYHDNIAIVGDAVQSLYGFRGAEIKNIQDFPNHFENCKEIYLKRNYRSTTPIIEFSNEVTKKAFQTPPHNLLSVRGDGVMPQVVRSYDTTEEARFIKIKIQEQLNKGVKPNDICVLFRSSRSSNILEGILNQEKIPYVKYGGKKFFELEYVKDILSFFRIYVNQNDEIAWFRCLQQVPLIGETNARRIAADCKILGVKGMLNDKYKKRAFYKDLCILHDFIQKMFFELTPTSIGFLIDFYCDFQKERIQKAKYSNEENREIDFGRVKGQRKNLDSLTKLVEKSKSIQDFLDSTIDNPVMVDDTDTAVILSTIHSAKGLEFDTVFIMDCVDGLFPSTNEDDAGSPEDEEELRCFYVASTRPRNKLFIMKPEYIERYGRVMKSSVSHFVDNSKVEWKY